MLASEILLIPIFTPYENQLIDLQYKLVDWFLCDVNDAFFVANFLTRMRLLVSRKSLFKEEKAYTRKKNNPSDRDVIRGN